MLVVELLVALFAAAVVLAWLARRVRVPYPIALVLGGGALALVPGLPRLPVDPNLILVIVLPPVLYQAALLTSWRDFRANLGTISLLAVGLVVATTVAVAATLKWLVPEVPWAAAFALGAIVSPPDAVAATAVLSRLNMPRRIVTILEGESLVNDASGLVLYRLAVAAVLTGAFSITQATVQFVLIAAGGIVVGVALGRLFVAIHRQLGDTLVEIVLSLVLPYAAYLIAETAHVSGVLAVVAAGLVRGRYAREAFSPEARIVAQSVWTVVVFLMNCFVFILIGLQIGAIREAGLGLNPITEGQLVRVPVPELSEERRVELTKIAHKYAEQARVAVRNVRRDGMDMLKRMEKDHKISEDEHHVWSEKVQQLTDSHIKKIDEGLAQKEKEILQV